jgi:hypothetical protein
MDYVHNKKSKEAKKLFDLHSDKQTEDIYKYVKDGIHTVILDGYLSDKKKLKLDTL